MKEERKPCFTRSCKMVLWPIRARVLFELFYNKQYDNSNHQHKVTTSTTKNYWDSMVNKMF